ncbi:21621_t:CDS:1, partial [Gigaspora margarita]
TVVDIKAATTVNNIGGTIVDVKAAASIDNISSTFEIKTTAAVIASVNDVGSFVAIIVSNIIGVFDLASIVSFDIMG